MHVYMHAMQEGALTKCTTRVLFFIPLSYVRACSPPLESTPNENTASLETAGQDERSTVSTATLCDMGGGSEGDWGYIILFPQPLKL